MNYDSFEHKFRRQPVAQRIAAEIRAEVARGRDAFDGTLPDAETLERLFDEWLPEGFTQCTNGGCETGPLNCGNRCDATYWRGHCRDVAAMMRALARVLGQDEALFHSAGMVHDLDYLQFPHHLSAVDSEQAHPVSTVKILRHLGAPPVLSLAVLEHSPHTGIPASSPLSNALIACDEVATMTAAGETPKFPDDVPAVLLECLTGASAVSITGFVRNDMLDRAVLALRLLVP